MKSPRSASLRSSVFWSLVSIVGNSICINNAEETCVMRSSSVECFFLRMFISGDFQLQFNDKCV